MTQSVDKPGGRGKSEAAALLDWYDRHARSLLWRARPGEKADPYRVWLSEIMLQQTTVKAVGPYFARFLARWPDVESLANAPREEVMREWAGLGYYARARNMHECAGVVTREHGGRFPDTEEALLALPGIGAYTAAAIAAIAFGRPAVVVDGNVERVVARLFAVETPLPAAKGELRALTARIAPAERPGDFAQAMMDLGATLCTPRRPACAICPLTRDCMARAGGAAETYPRRARRAERPTRFGAAFVAWRADGSLLLRERPAKGLLGGMSEVPTSEWGAAREDWAHAAPLAADWRRLDGRVEHVFTHFRLELTVYSAALADGAELPEGARWVPADEVSRQALPSVMRKVVAHAADAG